LSGVRTVVVSDLHLGSRSEADVLRRRAPRDKLIERVEGADRLVLLGDTIELRQGPAREAMAVAQPVLEELGGALGKGG
jgi:UDP-2,3-diacylglucosamine pyrophosphatase LpxH